MGWEEGTPELPENLEEHWLLGTLITTYKLKQQEQYSFLKAQQ